MRRHVKEDCRVGRGGLDCCALHLQSMEGTMNYYAENPMLTLRVSIGDAMLIADFKEQEREKG